MQSHFERGNQMRRFLLAALTVMLLAAHAKGEVYPLTALVGNLAYETDTVEVFDFNGNVWYFEGIEDWNVGDVCSMIMDDNGTDEVFDDIIICARYCGWLEGWWFQN